MRTRVKICGITNKKDAFLAADLGAFAVGFVFYLGSKRFIPPEEVKVITSGLPPFIAKVGVFVSTPSEEIVQVKEHCGLDRIQVYDARISDISRYIDPASIIAAHRIATKEDVEDTKKIPYFPLFDSKKDGVWGGSGMPFSWELLNDFSEPYILAGGIGPDNIDEALKLMPYGIDISSGVESSPGKKDPEKMRALFESLQ